MPQKRQALNIVQAIKSNTRDIVESFARRDISQGFSLLVNFVDRFEELIALGNIDNAILYNLDDLNGVLRELTEAMEAGDIVLIGDILEYRVAEFMDEIEIKIKGSN